MALVMFGLATGVATIKDNLPEPVYALLSGLNASTVGIIALAAVQLAEKCIKDKLSRVIGSTPFLSINGCTDRFQSSLVLVLACVIQHFGTFRYSWSLAQ